MPDLQIAWRTLRRNPGFALTIVLTLGLATGASTAIFSIVNSVLLRPLPFANPDRLVQVLGRNWGIDRPGEPDPVAAPVSSAQLLALIDESTLVAGFAGYATGTSHLNDGDRVERLTAVRADLHLFALLGSTAMAGRTFDRSDPPDVAVISEDLWRRRFGASRSISGTRIQLDGRAVTIVGVMPDAFQFPYGTSATMAGALPESRTDIWTALDPIRMPTSPTGLRQGRFNVIARLKDGVAPAAAEAELRAISSRFESRQAGSQRSRYDARVVPLRERVLGPISRSLWLLFAAAGLVLVAACANVANLLLARLAARLREVATRAALGATRAHLARLFLAESVTLAIGGAAVGIAVAWWGTDLFAVLAAPKIPRAHEIALDWRAFAFLLGACLGTALLFGVAPAMTAARVDARGGAETTRAATAGRGLRRLRDALVIAEVALAFVLATGAAWVIGEVIRLRSMPMGMNPANVVTLHVTPRATPREYYAIEQRVALLPGVEAAGFTQLLPLQNWGWEAEFNINGQPAPATGRLSAGLRYVTPGYFRTLQIPVRHGRGFFDTDTADSPAVLLVNEAFARRFFPGENPVGRALDRGTIVGVVGDVPQVSLGLPADPELFYVAAQNVTMAPDLGMSLVVRATTTEAPLMPAIRAAIADVNPRLAIFREKTMAQVIDDSLWQMNLYLWLIGAFAILVLTLAAIGLYGVIAYAASARAREFAIRLALGSNRASLARLVLVVGARLALAGLAAGAAGAIAITAMAGGLPAEIAVTPLAILAGAAAILFLTIAASAVPAVRVARVNPAASLRHE